MIVSHLLCNNQSRMFAVAPTEPVRSIVDVLARHEYCAVSVLDCDDALLGVITDHDVVRALASQGASALNCLAEDIMVREVPTCDGSTRQEDLLAAIASGGPQHFPVIAAGAQVGMVSVVDLVRFQLEQLGN